MNLSMPQNRGNNEQASDFSCEFTRLRAQGAAGCGYDVRMSGNGGGSEDLQTLVVANDGTPNLTVMQYASASNGSMYQPMGIMASGEGYLPGPSASTSTRGPSVDGERKRYLRLLRNKNAARECRRKKKIYVKCLEDRVSALENHNKVLIEEMKAMLELITKQC